MADVIISPNMNLPVPVVGVDPGPDWANNVNSCLSAIDSHNHTPGQGVLITPAAMNINTDLPMNGNNLTTARSVRFSPQSTALGQPDDLGCLYEVLADLFYNDGAGNQIRITQSGSVVGSSGTITGLPSGTASASFSGGTFTFQSATATPANIDGGSYVYRNNVANSKGLTLSPPNAMAADYGLVLPSIPAVTSILYIDPAGNITANSAAFGLVPLGGLIATQPQLTGAYVCTATTAADGAGYVQCQGQTIVDATSPMNGVVIPDLTDGRFLGGISFGEGGTGGANSVDLTHTHVDSGHLHVMSHTHQWGTISGQALRSLGSSDPSSTGISPAVGVLGNGFDAQGSGTGTEVVEIFGDQGPYYTTGVLSSPHGSGATASTELTSVSLPNALGVTNTTPRYLLVRYVMRIK